MLALANKRINTARPRPRRHAVVPNVIREFWRPACRQLNAAARRARPGAKYQPSFNGRNFRTRSHCNDRARARITSEPDAHASVVRVCAVMMPTLMSCMRAGGGPKRRTTDHMRGRRQNVPSICSRYAIHISYAIMLCVAVHTIIHVLGGNKCRGGHLPNGTPALVIDL